MHSKLGDVLLYFFSAGLDEEAFGQPQGINQPKFRKLQCGYDNSRFQD